MLTSVIGRMPTGMSGTASPFPASIRCQVSRADGGECLPQAGSFPALSRFKVEHRSGCITPTHPQPLSIQVTTIATASTGIYPMHQPRTLRAHTVGLLIG